MKVIKRNGAFIKRIPPRLPYDRVDDRRDRKKRKMVDSDDEEILPTRCEADMQIAA